MKNHGIILPVLFAAAFGKPAGAQIKLAAWSHGECDQTLDPYHIVDHLSDIALVNDTLFISIGFRENCCATFDPVIHLHHDTLFVFSLVGPVEDIGTNPEKNLLPPPPTSAQEDEPGPVGHAACGCDCCFSLNLVILGIHTLPAVIFFDGQRVLLSGHPYPVRPETFEIYRGDTVNRVNPYGQAFGKWLYLYENGQVKFVVFHEKPVFDPPPFSAHMLLFYSNGQLHEKRHNDTIAKWYESGQPESIVFNEFHATYQRVNTTYYFPGGQLQKHLVEGWLPDPFDTSKYTFEIFRLEEYFVGGQKKTLLKNDTLFKWDEQGRLRHLSYGTNRLDFFPNGQIQKRDSTWHQINTQMKKQEKHRLITQYRENGRLVSEELTVTTTTSGPYNVRTYNRTWNEKGRLVKNPRGRTGKFPR